MYYYVTKDTIHTVSEHAMRAVRKYFSREDLENLQADEVVCAPCDGHRYPCWVISGDKTLLGAFREETIEQLVEWLITPDSSLTKQIGKILVSRTRVAPLIDEDAYARLIREKEEPVERDYLNVWTEEPVGGFYFLAKTPHGHSVMEMTTSGCVHVRPWAEVPRELQDYLCAVVGHSEMECMRGNELIAIPKNTLHKWSRRLLVDRITYAWASRFLMYNIGPDGIATLNEWLLQNKSDTIRIGQFVLRNMSIETPIPYVATTEEPKDQVPSTGNTLTRVDVDAAIQVLQDIAKFLRSAPAIDRAALISALDTQLSRPDRPAGMMECPHPVHDDNGDCLVCGGSGLITQYVWDLLRDRDIIKE